MNTSEPLANPFVSYQPTQSGSVVTRRASAEEWGVCVDIAASLPNFFTREAVHEMLPGDLGRFGALVAEVNRSVAGFLVACRKTPGIAEILWLAVREQAQGQGVGSALIQGTVDACRAEAVRILEVKTLAPGTSDVGYNATRRFYEARSFELLEIIDPYPGWNPGNPCAIYVKPLYLLGAGATEETSRRMPDV